MTNINLDDPFDVFNQFVEEEDEDTTVKTPNEDGDDDGHEEEDDTTQQVEEHDDDVTSGPLSDFYELLVSNELLLPVEKFDGSVDGFKSVVQSHFDKLKEQAINSAVEELPDNLKLIIEYGKMGIDPKKIIDIVSGEPVNIYETEREKLNYIRSKYSEKIKSRIALESVISSIQENNEINDEFDRLYEEESETQKARLLRLVQERENEIAEQKRSAEAYALSFQNQVKELGWRKPKIDKVQKEIFERSADGRSSLENKLIHIASKSPKALAQLADFMLNYDESKGEFDLTSFKKVESQEAQRVKSEWESLINPNSATKPGRSNSKVKMPHEFYLP